MAKAKKKPTEPALEYSLTIGSIVKRILPYGTDLIAGGEPDWKRPPAWAADIFAAAAAVVHASSCYAELGVALSRTPAEHKLKLERARTHTKVGKKWAESGALPSLVKKHWATLFKSFDLPVAGDDLNAVDWKRAALDLVALADEAFAGAGFFPEQEDGTANYVWSELVEAKNRTGIGILELPFSMALLVPSEIACVLPKSLTPSVGCTLRSLTHHLAFLPSKEIVSPTWRINTSGQEINAETPKSRRRQSAPDGTFNILLVPFPYVMYATDFRVQQHADKDSDGYFWIDQGWLKDGPRRVKPADMTRFVAGLIRNAERDAGEVHAVVFPETALSEVIAERVAKSLARRFPALELMVAGIVKQKKRKSGTRNVAAQYSMVGGKVAVRVEQSKHHRWRLETNQIKQYQLGSVLDPNFNWWENIDVYGRTIGFSTNRDDAIISALVCEDLARYDPVLPVVSAVGPTLVIALLLDGPQLPNRWPGRYATVLAEDPGSAVLTLTNLGMIDRSARPDVPNRAVVGLWKDRHGDPRELILPPDHHGLVLSLNCCEKKQITLDSRKSAKPTIEYRLGAIRPVQLQAPPKWLERRAGNA